MDDDKLDGSYTVLENKLPSGVVKKIPTKLIIYEVLKKAEKPLTQSLIKKRGKIKSLGNMNEALNNLIIEGVISETICEHCEYSKMYELLNS